ncbi:putative Histone acetyltransferase gcn5 [Blattamonas nauphoetae]|uniref:histone acetyltransferase n=1 Tax=Blattamonas nauphoetae TaxID=2049346 RepID=A0ABQ9Y486_9EUKA|nr:putative Histone acetyltransferase gcn5 [Blattamonas nauphoetae]
MDKEEEFIFNEPTQPVKQDYPKPLPNYVSQKPFHPEDENPSLEFYPTYHALYPRIPPTFEPNSIFNAALNPVIPQRERALVISELSGVIRFVVCRNDATYPIELEPESFCDKQQSSGPEDNQVELCPSLSFEHPAYKQAHLLPETLSEYDPKAHEGSPQSLVLLVALKNLFSRQLPKMPREYITRLVFDRNHHSIMCLKNRVQVVAGITMRVFHEIGLGEIAFCAVDMNEQVRGYGNRIMAHAKEYARSIGLTFFLTYADNFAMEYFKKQGFSETITTPMSVWGGYLKDYDESTMMECIINPNIHYLRSSEMVNRQRALLLKRLSQISEANKVYDPPQRPQKTVVVSTEIIDGSIPRVYATNPPPPNENATYYAVDVTVPAKPEKVFGDKIIPIRPSRPTPGNGDSTINPTSESTSEMLKDETYASPPSSPTTQLLFEDTEGKSAREILKLISRSLHYSPPSRNYVTHCHVLMSQLYDQLITTEEIVWPFREPVDETEVADYYNLIRNPIDLTVIKGRLKTERYYVRPEIFRADLLRIAENAQFYNESNTIFHKCAEELILWVNQKWIETDWPPFEPQQEGEVGIFDTTCDEDEALRTKTTNPNETSQPPPT